jgi:hypothetical protein
VTIIRRESQFSGSKELTFFRFEQAAEEEPAWETKSPVYSTYSREVLSALRDRADLDMTIVREFSKLVGGAALHCTALHCTALFIVHNQQ